MRAIDLIVVHCSATPPDMNIGRTEIREWHMDKGWSDIGYHYVIRRNGDIEIGRPLEEPGAHARGYNTSSIGICLVGGVKRQGRSMLPENNFTPDQMRSLIVLLDGLTAHFNISLDEVVGHRDLPNVNKACPCFDVPGWLDAYEGEPLV